ncbi:unnamed protein product [Closterium sp. NIES-53]
MPPSMGAGGLAQQGRSTEQSVDLRVTYGQLSRTGARRLEQILVDETVDQGSLMGRSTEQSINLRRTCERQSTRGVWRQQLTVLVDGGVRRPRWSSTGALVDEGGCRAGRALGGRPGNLLGKFCGCTQMSQWRRRLRAAPYRCRVSLQSSSTSSSGSSSGSSSSSGGSRSMWLYKVKRPPGSPPVFKVRYVARGFNQCEGVDFFQTFAPTPKTLRVLRHIAALRDYDLHSLDFFAAFLQGSLLEQIWLRRLVYSLRQAPSEWHNTLCTTLAALDFFPSSADTSLFVRRGSTPFFVLVYVDDMVFATPNRHALASVKEELQRRHTCSDLGELQCYLGLQITRDRAARTITLTQSHMVKPILTRVLGRFVAPGRHRPSHWYAAKRVAKYVVSKSGMGLVLGGKQPVTLTSYHVDIYADLGCDLHERIFLQRPLGFRAAFPENTVWQLRRPVYGLKQAMREWYAKLFATLGSLGFSDLEKFEMAQAKPVSTPLPFGHQLAPPTSPSSSSHPYAELIGLLMYAMMCTCADLAYPISVLARFVGTSRHTTEHWQATKRVLRYLRRTKDHVLTLGGPFPPLLLAFRDSSWADSQPNRRSSQCCGFTLGSGLVSWRSTSSSAIALSFCEAELYAGIMAAQESRWLCFLLAELGAPQHCPTLWCDNASTIHLTQDPVYHARSKHIVLE